MEQRSQTSYYLVSLFAVLRELPGEARERELAARCEDPELKQQLRRMLDDDRTLRAPQLAAGMLLDHRYELEQLLGEGASASVWSAHDRKLQRKAALKIFDRGLCAKRDLDRALQEARHASHVASEHVIRIRDVAWCKATELPYIEMEPCAEQVEGRWQHGQSMAQTPARDQRELIRWLIEAARGVQAAHECGVYHCDLKPHNILIRPNRSAVVTDFGLSVRARGSAEPECDPSAGRWIAGGTPSYMAPERIEGLLDEPAVASESASVPHLLARADVYALGAVLYHMLAGEPPYPIDRAAAEPLVDVFCRIGSGAPPPLGPLALARGVRLAAGLERVVERAMARDPSCRHASAAAFADDLGRCLERLQASQRTRARVARVFRFAPACVAATLTLSTQLGAVGLDTVATRSESVEPLSLPALSALPVPTEVALDPGFASLLPVVPDMDIAQGADSRLSAHAKARAVVAPDHAKRRRSTASVPSRPAGGETPAKATNMQGCVAPAPGSHDTARDSAAPPPPPTAIVESSRTGLGDAEQLFAFVRRAKREPEQLVKVVHAGQRAPAYCLLEGGEDGPYTCLHQDFVVGEVASSLRSLHRHSELQREWIADIRGQVTRACETTNASGSFIRPRVCEQPPRRLRSVALHAGASVLAARTASSAGGWP